MAGLIQKTFNQAVNRTAFSLALQSVRLPLRWGAQEVMWTGNAFQN